MFTRGSEAMKAAAADDLYAALEKVIPDVRSRVEVEMVATPLTQRRFVRRHRGGVAQAFENSF